MTREDAKQWIYRKFNQGEAERLMADLIIKALEQEPVLDKIRAEIDKQEKWLLQAGYNAYNVDIAFDAIKAVVSESEDK